MATRSLAIKYRPTVFDAMVEQESIKKILLFQLTNNDTKNAYLFCGSAGTGKTTCARIFANEINKHMGNPIEIDAASNSSVEDVKVLIQQAKTKSLDSEYKVFIIDECHSLSNTAWQALLKLLEEPPLKSVFIFCTTDPQKIPKTILSRVQRYDFQRISTRGIYNRIMYVLSEEGIDSMQTDVKAFRNAIDYVAKIADGGMRDALTMLDKCLAYSTELTLENVLKALGRSNYDTMFNLLESILGSDYSNMLGIIDEQYRLGIELKQFIKSFTEFVLDICKVAITNSFDITKLPNTDDNTTIINDILNKYGKQSVAQLVNTLVSLNSQIKWETNPKPVIESVLLLSMGVNNDRTI